MYESGWLSSSEYTATFESHVAIYIIIKLKLCLYYNFKFSLLQILTDVHKQMRTNIFMAILFEIAKHWNNLKVYQQGNGMFFQWNTIP